jgi:hypothetical protein
VQGVLVQPEGVANEKAIGWKKEGLHAVALVLDERADIRLVEKAARAITAESLDLYFWIEVGRNEAMARGHPEWMASFGMHDDWRRRFPKQPPLGKDEVAKVWPWVPIAYRESFDAHLDRIRKLLAKAPAGYRGVFLNDLQGGPSSCGCGNIECRWATDYGVASTATKLDGADMAARFVTAVASLIPGQQVIPVWTPECEPEDLPIGKLPSPGWSTAYCGDVTCFETCRKKFEEQLSALNHAHCGSTGMLLVHREFQRDRQEYGGRAAWISRAFGYWTKQSKYALAPRQWWVVVQGYDVSREEEARARQEALNTGARAVLVAHTRIDQSYEPRIVKKK